MDRVDSDRPPAAARRFAFRFHSLQSRIAIYFAVLMICAQGVVMVIVDTGISRNAREKIEEELKVGERVFRRLLDQNNRQLTQGAEILSRDFAFRDAVATNDVATIVSVLRNHGSRIDAAVMMLAAPDGKLIADTRSGGAPGSRFAFPWLIEAAEREGRAAGMVLIDARAYQLVVVPVLAPAPIAWAAFGFPVDDRIARELQSLTELHISFLSRGGPAEWSMLASTMPPERHASLRAAVAAAPGPASASTARGGGHKLSVGEYESLLLPLEQRPEYVIVAVLGRSLDEALAPFRRLESVLLLLAVASLCVSVALGVLIARGISRPIQALTGMTRRVEEGDYSQAVTVRGHDEIGDLAQHFNLMREGIAAREAQILRLAYRDALTDLPNRALFHDRLKIALERARRSRSMVTVMLMDLNRFKFINDALGHQAGDQVLKLVAERLSGLLRKGDTTARLGGDEFAMLLADTTVEEAAQVVHKILAALEAPIMVGELAVDVTVSIGVAAYPLHGQDGETLLRRSDTAMYAAKRANSGHAIYDPERDDHSGAELSLLGDLRRAIDRNELHLAYQPKIEIGSGRVAGVECLLRWIHPVRGPVAPVEFIPFCEQTGFIKAITRWVIEAAVTQCGAWRDRGIALRIAVNISAQDLLNPKLPDMVSEALARHRVPVELLSMEITESGVMQEPARAIELLGRLHALGVTLSIDDFGTGYSSLSYVKRLPVHELKIDRSFTRNIVGDLRDRAIVLSTIELGHNLGLTVVAEGVEDTASLEMLHKLGCDYAQGYAIARPLDAHALLQWLAMRDLARAGGAMEAAP